MPLVNLSLKLPAGFNTPFPNPTTGATTFAAAPNAFPPTRRAFPPCLVTSFVARATCFAFFLIYLPVVFIPLAAP